MNGEYQNVIIKDVAIYLRKSRGDVDTELKNQFLKTIIDRIDYV